MGQKVNPINFRLQVNKNWSSRWFTANKKEFAEAIRQDHEIRELIEKKFASRPTINRIEIERSANLITITIHSKSWCCYRSRWCWRERIEKAS